MSRWLERDNFHHFKRLHTFLHYIKYQMLLSASDSPDYRKIAQFGSQFVRHYPCWLSRGSGNQYKTMTDNNSKPQEPNNQIFFRKNERLERLNIYRTNIIANHSLMLIQFYQKI